MKIQFENLLYDHGSLLPLRGQTQDIEGSAKSGYPGKESIIKALGAIRQPGAAEIYKLNDVYFQFRYSGVGQKAFGGMSDTFSNIDTNENTHKLVITISKSKSKEGADLYSVGCAAPDQVKGESWNVKGDGMKSFTQEEAANKWIIEQIKKEAGI